MALDNSPEGSQYVDVAAGDVPGSGSVPATVEFTMATTPNRMFARFARRTVGDPTNLKTIYSPGDTLTFAGVDIEDSVSWTENVDVADKTGRFSLLAKVKDASATAGQFGIRAELDIAGAGSPTLGRAKFPTFSHLSSAAWEMVDLGEFTIPANPAPTSWDWRVVAWRTTGTANVLIDYLLILPTDESYGVLDWTATSDVSASTNKKFTLSTPRREAWWGDKDEAPLAYARFGNGLTLKPAVYNRIIVQVSADTAWPAKATPAIDTSVFSGSPPIAIDVEPRSRAGR